MEPKTGAEAVAESIAEAKNSAAEAVVEVKSLGEGVKELAKTLTEGFASIKEKEVTEEMKSLNAKLEEKSAEANNLKEKLKLADAGQGSFSEGVSEEETKSISAFTAAIEGKSKTRIEEYKSIRVTDPTVTGFFTKQGVNRGIVSTNEQPMVTLLSDVDVLPAVNTIKEESFIIGYDSSLLDLDEANEMTPAQIKEAIQHSKIVIQSRKETAKIPVSSDLILAARAGDRSSAQLVQRNLDELKQKFMLRCVKKAFKDIIDNANSSDTVRIAKFETATDDATAADTLRQDLRNLPTKLKKNYVGSSIMFISRTFLNSIFSKQVSDGHLPLEQFEYRDGITYFLTPEKSYIVRTFEHDQIGNYKSLKDGSTVITADFNPAASAGGNAGVLLAMVGDFKKGYKYQPSTAGTMGYDGLISELLDGVVYAGVISYVAQGLAVKESLKVLYSK